MFGVNIFIWCKVWIKILFFCISISSCFRIFAVTTILLLLNCLWNFFENFIAYMCLGQLLGSLVCFTDLFVFMLIPHYLSCYNFTCLKIRWYKNSSFPLHFQSCFGYSLSIAFPFEFQNQFVNFYPQKPARIFTESA